MIWSDPKIQEMTRNFVCATADCFFLNPPSHIRNLPDPEGTKIFQRYMKTAPRDTWPRKNTQQGVYIMTPDGDNLYGKFVSVTKSVTVDVMNTGLAKWNVINKKHSKPIPTNHLRPIVSDNDPGKLQIRVSYRDLPRGKILRPGAQNFPNPFNLEWYDLKKSDLHAMVFEQNQEAWKNFVLKTMKDSVRGEMSCFYYNDWKGGRLGVTHLKEEGPYSIYRINSDFSLRKSGNITYKAKVYGEAVYDRRTKEFTEFTLLAAGPRTGAGPSNNRWNDRGSAPMAIAVRINY